MSEDQEKTKPTEKVHLNDASAAREALKRAEIKKVVEETKAVEGMIPTPQAELGRDSVVKLAAKVGGITPREIEENLQARNPQEQPQHTAPFVTETKPKVDWQPWQKEADPIEENQEYVAKNMPWAKRVMEANRAKVTKQAQVPPPTAPEPQKNTWFSRIMSRFSSAKTQEEPTGQAEGGVLKRQSTAGAKGQPELTTEERREIQEINFPSIELSNADRELLKKQGTAGIGGQPELTPEERRQVAEINSRPKQRQPK